MSFLADVKAALDPLLQGNVFREQAPDGTPTPYVTLYDDILRLPSMSGDGRTLARRRRLQATLWQTMTAEDDGFVAEVEAAIETVQGEAPRTRATVTFSRRLPYNPDQPNLSQRVMWVEIAERTPLP